jgi:nitrate reductase NapAB chaperone NapD
MCVPGVALPQGAPLGPEFRANTYTTSNQEEPSVAADALGNFVVVWQSYGQDGLGYGIFGQRYASSGAPLGPEFQVNTYTPFKQKQPAAAADASGDIVVVWATEPNDQVFGQRYASSGAPLGSEFQVNSYSLNYTNRPSVAADAAGNLVVVWQSSTQDGSNYGVFGQRYASSGAPLGSEFRINTYTTDDQTYPSVAADTAGNFVVVWQSRDQDGSDYGVFGQRYASSGSPLGPEFRVSTHTTYFQGSPVVAANGSGDFVVVWHSATQDGSGRGVFGQRYASSGAPLGSEFRVNTYTTAYQGGPIVAEDASGSFVVVWQSQGQDGSQYGIFAQRYLSSGAPLGPEFRVNTYTTAYQGSPFVAADPSGNFVVVWRSDGQDGSGKGIFGQRYGQIVPLELIGFDVE